VPPSIWGMKTYLYHFFVSFDYFCNCILRGLPHETLSSRAYRMEQKNQPYWKGLARCINLLFFWQANHCRGAYHADRARAPLPLVEPADAA
jgi:hypothetical protein